MTLQTAETASPSIADVIALLDRMPAGERDSVLAACSSRTAAEDTSYMPTPFDAAHPPAGWRSILDVPPISVLAPIFASPYWMKLFERGTEIQAYSATCSGLKQLGIALGLTTPKFGTCALGKEEKRVHDLGLQQYGAVRRDGNAYIHENGFSSYEHLDRLKIATQPAGCPVRNGSYGLIVAMPLGWKQKQYDLRLNLALRPFRLTTFADSMEGRAICAARGVPVERLVRYYGCGRTALQGADEILVVDPFKDGCRLATVLALVVIQHVAPELVPAELRKLVPLVGEAANLP